MLQDYPREWPRNIDFIPLLGLQGVLDKMLKIYYCDAQVSVQERTAPTQDITTEYGILRVEAANKTQMRYVFGGPEPDDEVFLSAKELMEDATSHTDPKYLGRYPDIILKGRGVLENIPKKLEDTDMLQGEENIYYLQTSSGNWTHKLRNMTNLQLNDFYRFIKSDMMVYLNMTSRHPIFMKTKLRSALKTKWLYTHSPDSGNKGYSELGKEGIFNIEKELVKDKWWQDVGLVHPIQAQIDHTILQGSIYKLWKRKDKLIVL